MDSNRITPLITTTELRELLEDELLVIIDARSGVKGADAYHQNHITGALHVDLDSNLSDVGDPTNGGRHPLPDIHTFIKTLNQLGIFKESKVVIYDDQYGANAAARFWWMLRSIGHQHVQVLDGGYQKAITNDLPVSNAFETPTLVDSYEVDDWKLPTVELNEVKFASENTDQLIIDVREPTRYRGEQEPIDLIAGHIPGAINVFFKENLDSNGCFLPAEVLKEKYLQFVNDKNPEKVIIHCGSGVTACHTLLAFDYAGLEIPKLYVGSWSEWSRNNLPIATEH